MRLAASPGGRSTAQPGRAALLGWSVLRAFFLLPGTSCASTLPGGRSVLLCGPQLPDLTPVRPLGSSHLDPSLSLPASGPFSVLSRLFRRPLRRSLCQTGSVAWLTGAGRVGPRHPSVPGTQVNAAEMPRAVERWARVAAAWRSDGSDRGSEVTPGAAKGRRQIAALSSDPGQRAGEHLLVVVNG